MKQFVSAIIPTWNGQKTIVACIRSLMDQSLPLSEIIVVDNGSTDETVSLIKKSRFPRVKLLSLSINTGVAKGRNVGIKAASKKSHFLFLFDHDMVAGPTMIEELVKIAQQHQAGIVTPKIYYLRPKNLIWAAGTDVNLWTGQVIFRNGVDRGQFDRSVRVGVAPAAMLIHRQVIEDIGGFDTSIVSVWEDTDFSFRARKEGYEIWYAPRAIAYHDLARDPAAQARRLLGRYGWYVGRNRILFMKKFGHNFWIFVWFVPVYVLYYALLSLRYGQLTGYTNFLKGTISGLLTSPRGDKRLNLDN